MSDFYSGIYNPDVLSCLANLSNDEVFTPPEVANQVLDMLPQELFSDPNTTFLDPACKSGVFLREIAKRLITGLEPVFPDLQERLDHIFHKQLYAIAITELTSLLSRRGVYCSKYPNGKYSVSQFDDAQGNIRFKRIQHRWQNKKCIFCGASQGEYDREESLETHAYEFIHTSRLENIFNMKFDVLISNPPYQLSDSGHGASAMPIYQKFVEQAKKLKPRYMSMIIPSRWFAGGRGLDEFRKEMLSDRRIRVMHDYLKSSDCFPGVQIEGGICYFLWDRDNCGDCTVYTHREGDKDVCVSTRPLLEEGTDIFIRDSMQLQIYKKIRAKNEQSFMDIVSANDPYGFDVREKGGYKRVKPTFETTPFKNSVTFYYFGWQKEGVGYVDPKYIRKNADFVDKWKVYISRAYGMGDNYPTQVINRPFVGSPNSCCTETYLNIGPFDNEEIAKNAVSYICTKFFRFQVMLIKSTQQAMKPVYALVPMQDFSKPWTDEELYAKYGLSAEEIEFIETMIKPMDLSGSAED